RPGRDHAGRRRELRGPPSPGEVRVTSGSARVMVVEDDADIREVLTLVLEAHGYDVTVAADGEQALALIRTGPPPSLVLLDLTMPGIDGEEVARTMRADPGLGRIPIVVMSGRGDAAARAQALGVEACLSKPAEVADILAQVRRFTAGDA